MMRHLPTKIALLTLALLPSFASALPSDREQPISIEADHAQMDDTAGITQYKGKAILTQGTLRIEGDMITFYYDENKQLSKAVADGNLATYKQIQKEGEEPVRARALRMEYHAKKQMIYLLGKGHVWQNGDEFTGNRIEYDIEKNLVNAKSAPVTIDGKTQQPGRVHIIIQPPGGKSKPAKPKASTPAPQVESKSIEPTQIEPAADLGYPTARTNVRLNVRTGPGTNYNKIAVFNLNDDVLILSTQNEWVQVRGEVNGETVIGWVNKHYLVQD
jgi:lipopolysaccharide export system protein LptA